MYRVVIVEDDRIIRKAMIQSDWSSIDVEIVGEASDGQQAMEVIMETNPQLVVTDINMPFMNGVELGRKLRKVNASVRIIFLTGFDDFDYVREAMLLRSDDYLLKPVQSQDLLTKVKKALESWTQEHEKNERLVESLPLLHEKVVRRILYHGGSDQLIDIQKELNRFDVYLSGPEFVVLNIVSPQFHTTDSRTLYHRLTKWQRHNEIAVLSYQNNDVFMIISIESDQQEAFKQLIKDIRKDLLRQIEVDVIITVSSLHSEVQHIELAILESKIKMEQLKISMQLNMDDKDLSDESTHKVTINGIKAFADLLTTQTFQLEEAKSLALHMLSYIGMGINQLVKQESNQVNIQHISQKVLKSDKTAPILIEIMTLVDRWEEEVKRNQYESQSETLVDKAITYLKTHFAEPDLTLVRLADEIHVSSPYLSNLFKTETNKNFTEYVLELRMEKAKELLESTRLRTYEIAEQIGYINPHYFSSTFKKYTQQTPIEYRKRHPKCPGLEPVLSFDSDFT